jgi:hypothetical protein
LTSEQILQFARGQISDNDRIGRHLPECQDCQKHVEFAKMQAQKWECDKAAFLAGVRNLNRKRSGSLGYALQPFRRAFSGVGGVVFFATAAMAVFWFGGSLSRLINTHSKKQGRSVATSIPVEEPINPQIQEILAASDDPTRVQEYAHILKTDAVKGQTPITKKVVAARQAVENNLKVAKDTDENAWQLADYDLAPTEFLSRYDELCRTWGRTVLPTHCT